MANKKKAASAPPERITGRWLAGLLERKLPGMLLTVGQNESQLVTDFIRLTLLERSMFPPKREPRVVIWTDWVDQDGNEILR